jgi:hypothetical protein
MFRQILGWIAGGLLILTGAFGGTALAVPNSAANGDPVLRGGLLLGRILLVLVRVWMARPRLVRLRLWTVGHGILVGWWLRLAPLALAWPAFARRVSPSW